MNKNNFLNRLKTKQATTIFALVALIGGFLFLNQSNVTGNIILSKENPINIISLIGLLLILFSVVLSLYSIKKK